MEHLHGIVHGRMIELETESGFPDGQPVTIVVRAMPAESKEAAATPLTSGLRRAFGSWLEDAKELDEYLVWNRNQRRIGTA